MARKILSFEELEELSSGEVPLGNKFVPEEHDAREAWLLLGADYQAPLMQPDDELNPPCDGMEQ